jgi:proline iminopeptidase
MYSPKPYKEHFLPKEDGHKVYFAEYGNPDGEAIVSIHGGPGSQAKSKHASRLNLDQYRVILFDQRACGKSEFSDPLIENTIQKLALDMERIRKSLNIDKWYVTGGSWGSTLALFYSQAYPETTKGLMLSAVFLGDKLSTDWFGGSKGVSMLYTEVWEHRNKVFESVGLEADASAEEINQKLLVLEDEEQKELVVGILNWEGNLMSSTQDVTYIESSDVEDKDIVSVKVFMHYESNEFFMEADELLNKISEIKHIPMVIVHGRHDILCPYKRAWDLHKLHPNSEIVSLPQSNHSFSADGEIAKRYIYESFLLKNS